MPSVRASAARLILLLVLALTCGTSVPPGPAGSAPRLQQLSVRQAAPAPAYESAHAGGGEAEAPTGSSVLHRDRRRTVTAPAGPSGPPPLVTRAAPLTDPPAGRGGGPDPRRRPLTAPDVSTLQVFLC
ncbi:hypothetical protein [Streptomyces sp. NPDC008121]|uniref:hypothetical protein n=1 Tax=Streptomyces sp. NPDC008121 TaxID=3364809 RepID=UPI0036E15ADE